MVKIKAEMPTESTLYAAIRWVVRQFALPAKKASAEFHYETPWVK
ncbi:hypothetical protein [Serratia quinivorans]|jgi:hypothetical protein|nr:hypothetical protein [Serratia quinivorans]